MDGCARWRRPAQGPWQGAKDAKKLHGEIKFGSNFQKNLNELGSKLELGLGWLRAVAQGYSSGCNGIKLKNQFERNLTSWGVKLGWGLDGCARWRKVTITVTVKLSWRVIFKRI